jgi:prevent-host-death family protein
MHLSKLLKRVETGEVIVIGKAGKPLARLAPYAVSVPRKRKPESWKGKIKILPGFDEMDKKIERLFSGEPD